MFRLIVALRKESVDRKFFGRRKRNLILIVALRKESVDRKNDILGNLFNRRLSLSVRRAWIENPAYTRRLLMSVVSLSVRRAWIENL